MDCLPLDLIPFVCFAIEAGGHYTLYNKDSEEVIMFNTDPGLPYI
jgi:hypothetical protein